MTIIFKITPTTELRQILSRHHIETERRTPGAKLQKSKISFFPRGLKLMSPVEFMLQQPAGPAVDQISYVCKFDAAASLVGPGAFTTNPVLDSVSLGLRLFKKWAHDALPALSEEVTAELGLDCCELHAVTASYYFERESATEALRTLLRLQNTAKTIIDFALPFPGRRSELKRQAPAVLSDIESRSAFTAGLSHRPQGDPFGTLKASVLADRADFPSSFNNLTAAARVAATKAAERVVKIEVETLTGTPLHFGEETDFTLPSNACKWTPELFPKSVSGLQNPFQIIWEATRYALWLNHPLASNVDSIQKRDLSDRELEVLDCYLAGEDVSAYSPLFSGDGKQFLDVRGTLIRKAAVDLLVPWSRLQLNDLGSLAETLEFTSRLDPSQNEHLASHTLTKPRMAKLVSEISEKLPPIAES